ncbi:NAD(P)/FAD-dependent oxidoreductase [Saccharothrix yanglingensis]|uniref:Pyridine nucleotide-disulfide oxidoreductase n=1 Tax=Saccharothrix yanglingensis TaxID=659496 RepID=A0ABU0X9Z0_9PSEU|nr:NAD(P)/FAD-dependent oxidoreductase [Saccharothrix yanglingensis]MDQ2588960.1 pyridine nucleotide-disulfide oxidoreductase [Saccharothrix yanglingensis]
MYDVVVVGGGPAGLSAALVFGRQRRSVLVVDGGEPRNSPASEMHMYLSRDGFPPQQLLALGREELAAYPGVEVRTGLVVAARGAKDDFELELADGAVVRARRVVLATGQVDEPYDIPGLAERFGRSVFHCPFCHGWEAGDKTLAVVTREPVEAMLALYLGDRFSQDVVLCTDGPIELPEPVAAAVAARALPIVDEKIVGITGDADDLTIHFADGSTLRREAVFHRAPTRQHSGLAEQLGCEVLPDGTIKVDEIGQTTTPGVSAAGDMAKLPGMPDATTLVVLGAADGVRAAVWMEGDLFRSGLGVFPS